MIFNNNKNWKMFLQNFVAFPEFLNFKRIKNNLAALCSSSSSRKGIGSSRYVVAKTSENVEWSMKMMTNWKMCSFSTISCSFFVMMTNEVLIEQQDTGVTQWGPKSFLVSHLKFNTPNDFTRFLYLGKCRYHVDKISITVDRIFHILFAIDK